MAQSTIECSRIKVGSCFNEPVFFEDGVNMFLAANHPAKQYHLAALKRWNIPYLLTSGVEIDYNKYLEEKALMEKNTVNKPSSDIDNLEDLEELEEL